MICSRCTHRGLRNPIHGGGVEWGGRFEDVESSEESHVCRGVE